MTSLCDKADAVRVAVTSISTCTSATVTLLSTLLLPTTAEHDNPTQEVSRLKKGALKGSSAATTAKSVKSGRTTKDSRNGSKQDAQLSPKEKGILATEVINATLKVLNAPVKNSVPVRHRQSSQDLIKESARRALRRSNSLPQSPLQPRSLHRVSSTPSIGVPSSRSSSSVSIGSGARAAAECARLAFSCLRILQLSKTSCMSDLPPFQLENGMSALIGKLILLGIDDLALKELRILKRRLEPTPKIVKKQPREHAASTDTTTMKALSLAEILQFEHQPESGLALNLAIATQFHVLRLLASSKKQGSINASLPILLYKNLGSPTQLILRAVRESSIPTPKAAKQLDTLSQTLLSLCPSVASSEDERVLNSSLNSPPEVALQLQVIAFQSRVLWWNLSGHHGDVEKEILDPFCKCLSSFARRSQGEPTETYQIALDVLQMVQETLASYDKSSSKAMGLSAAAVYKILGTLAQNARCYEDAINWIEKTQISRKDSSSDTQRCSIAAGLLAMRLLSAPSDLSVEELLMEVIEGIGGPLKGSSQDLDELLTEVSQARRAAVSLLSKRRTGSSTGPIVGTAVVISDGIRQMCESLVLQCPRFTLRFLGPKPESNAVAKTVIRYEQRRQFVARSAFNTVDSALYLIKVFQSDGRSAWDLMDSTLQDCIALLEAIGEISAGIRGGKKEAPISYFVKISNLYYAQHLNMRRDAEGPKDNQHLRPLRRSIDCVRNRPNNEKKESILLSKLERISDMYRSIDRLDEAREFAIILRDELVGNGALSTVTALAGSEPILRAWEHNEETSLLARAIATILRVDLKLKRKGLESVICDPNWSPKEKGAVLELCLDVLSKSSKEVLNFQQDILKELLSLYGSKQFPLRRLRVTIRLLRIDEGQGRCIIDDVRSTLTLAGSEALVMESEDCDLNSYLPHLQALASTIMELQEEHPRTDLLKPHLATWYSALENFKDYETLTRQVDDVSDLLNHLHSIADFLHMKGFCTLRIAVLRMIANINEIPRPEFSPDELVMSYSTLASQYLELGYSGKAGLVLDRAHSLASQHTVGTAAFLRLQISYAEYLITLGNFNKCEETLLHAQATAFQIFPSVAVKNRPATSSRTGMKQLVADAHMACSLLALEKGATKTALSHAKRSLRLNRFAWSSIAMQRTSREVTPEKGQMESLTDDVANVSISSEIPQLNTSVTQPLGPSLWASVNPLFRSLCHVSKLYAHHGMFRETMYYSVQAYQLVKMTNSVPYIASALVAKGSTWLNAGTLDQASELLMEARNMSVASSESHVSILLNCSLGKLHGLLDSHDSDLTNYDEAHATLEALTSENYISNIDRIVDPTTLLEAEMSQLAIKPKKTTINRKLPAGKRLQARKMATIIKVPEGVKPALADECLHLASLRGFMLRQKASSLLLWKKCDEALSVLKEADRFSRSQIDAVDQHIGMAKQLLFQAIELMTLDPVYSTLQDSTISLPAIVSTIKGIACTTEGSPRVRLSPPRKTPGRDRARTKSPSFVSFYELLQQSYDHLSDAHSSATQISSTSVNHNLSSLLHTVTVLLSVAGPSKGKPLAHPNFAACSLEISRNIALERERRAILDDFDVSFEENSSLIWPTLSASDPVRSSNSFMSETARFQKDYIDIIPFAWTVVSISLSDSQNELCVTKIQAGASPFVLRLPLGRNNSRDIDEQVFDFKQGKNELQEIITAANYTSHSARELKGRDAKIAWWEEREALDVRMKELLENMENVWLGGFKGVFSQHQRRPDLLARFQKSFQLILNKHLPSRQNLGRKSSAPKITLDPRIWELFIGLGDVTVEGCDFDEPLTDLLYFVVDVLQFHGERNALDEIDFDSVVIETLDALRCYHEAILSSTTGVDDNNHTILILDKALHAFPWESLPCMDGLAVSRLPSLSCLRDRILKHKNTGNDSQIEGHHVDRTSGAYVLNPGGDLKSTQTAFEGTLQNLSGWNAIVKREPSELEFKENLESKDILLYFGHGSGAQYIRAKAIKRLEKCAVAILMGCSSGALSEAGDFEPYGPPMDYMLAGCPSLVATLWDVTDQDIDRFAKSTFDHWGLFKSEVVRNENGGKGKGKKKGGQVPVSNKVVSLAEAVAKGKKACNFRYLTAAAVCVYGIPVYFK